MKKFCAMLLSLVMMLSTSSSALAAIPHSNNSIGTSELYISTPNVPEDVIEFAKADFKWHLNSFIEDGDFDGNPLEIKLGTPFTYLANEDAITQYYFPVMYDGKIVYIYRVYEDVIYREKTGNLRYTGSMSSILANVFSELSLKTSKQSPAIVIADNTKIVALTNSGMQILSNNQNTLSDISLRSLQNYNYDELRNELETVEATCSIQYDKINTAFSLSTSSVPTSYYIPLSITESQGDEEPWCAAYTAAAIIRTVKGVNLSAADIIDYYNAASTGLYEGQVINYAQVMYQLNPLYYESALSKSEVQHEIINDMPIYARMYHSLNVSHAVAIRGYNSTTYSIWNPWYINKYESFSINTLTYVPSSDSRAFYWNNGIYNWQ